MRLPLFVVDSFADRPFSGNPAAVVPLSAWLPDETLRGIAAENALSETAFPVRKGEGWHLRWFSPKVEVELCGHGTLATAFVLESLGFPAPWRFESASGPLTVVRDGPRLVMDFPAWASRPADPPAGLAEALGAAPLEVHCARDWICVFESPERVAGLSPDFARIAALPGGRVLATARGGEGVDITSRNFTAKFGVPEDPVTGAAHTQLVPFWAPRLGKTALVCRQASARGGILWTELAGDRVRIGGLARLYAKGEIELPD